jgi:three-Cys-motif partner protein
MNLTDGSPVLDSPRAFVTDLQCHTDDGQCLLCAYRAKRVDVRQDEWRNTGMKDKQPKPVPLDEIGEWSELKLEILRKYASAYSTILNKKNLHHAYVEGFAGAGQHVSKRSKELVPGSPLNALNVEPPFEEYYFVEVDSARAAGLQAQVAGKQNVHVFCGDSNQILLSDVFPKIQYSEYKRALCILDPYGLHLNWSVIAAAAGLGTIEIFLNFPILDMNRNVLWRNEKASDEDVKRMNMFWGDDSWRNVAYRSDTTLFGEPEKQPNEVIADSFRQRLRKTAGFKHVPEPAPMRNSKGNIVYYLFFAAQQPAADKIVGDIFSAYRKRGVLHG